MKRKNLIKAISYLHYRWMDSFDSLTTCLENGRNEWKLFISEVIKYGLMEQVLIRKLNTLEETT